MTCALGVILKFKAKAIVVGHTVQSKFRSFYNGKAIGIDVRHPKDYHNKWPNRKSEGLLLLGGKYFSVFNDGSQEAL